MNYAMLREPERRRSLALTSGSPVVREQADESDPRYADSFTSHHEGPTCCDDLGDWGGRPTVPMGVVEPTISVQRLTWVFKDAK